MADASGKRPERAASRRLDEAIRERLQALLLEALAHAGEQALARGATPQELSAQLDSRIARLRALDSDQSDEERAA